MRTGRFGSAFQEYVQLTPPLILPHAAAVSAIVPVHDSSATLAVCLEALRSSSSPPAEIVVVDDCSRDASREIATGFGCTVVSLEERGFQARARNKGARIAQGEVLLFVDSDVIVEPTTIEKALQALADVGSDAVVVPFDPESPAPGFWSQYKHLIMTFNQRSFSGPIRWTNTSFLMVRRRVFDRVGGFDESLPRATCEDFQFGLSLAKYGAIVVLEKRVAVRHLRALRLRELVVCQLQRSIAFGRILAGSLKSAALVQFPVARSIQLSSFALPSAVLCLACTAVRPQLAWGAPLAGAALCVLNRRLLRYLAQLRGVPFAMAACAVLAFDTAICCAAFLFGFARYLWRPPALLAPASLPDGESA